MHKQLKHTCTDVPLNAQMFLGNRLNRKKHIRNV